MTRSCPDCGHSLEGAFVVHERLSTLGYTHRDQTLECPECPWRGSFGHPVDGETDQAPACEVCGGRTYPYKLDFHEVQTHIDEIASSTGGNIYLDLIEAVPTIDVHWKCEDCHYRFNGEVEHLTADVYSLGVSHLEGRRDDA